MSKLQIINFIITTKIDNLKNILKLKIMQRDKAIRDITKEETLEEIIKSCKTCHVGMVDGSNKPYVLSFNFGFKSKTIYLHCAKEGKKLEILKQNNNVCVYFDTDHEIFSRNETVACSWRMRYRSVMVHGKAEFVEDYDQKIIGLKTMMENYSDINFSFSKPAVNNIEVIKIEVSEWTGRSFEYL